MGCPKKYSDYNNSISTERKIILSSYANAPDGRIKYDRSREWKTRKDLRIEGAGFKCEECGETKKLEVHHVNYDNFGNELYEDLKILCKKCHTNFHKINPRYDHIALTSTKKTTEEKLELDLSA